MKKIRIRKRKERKERKKKLFHHTKHLAILLQEDPVEGFGEHVGQHISCAYVEQGNFMILNALPDEVVACMDVFGARMVFRVLGKGFGTLVVDMEWDRIVWAEPEFLQDVTKP